MNKIQKNIGAFKNFLLQQRHNKISSYEKEEEAMSLIKESTIDIRILIDRLVEIYGQSSHPNIN